MTKGHNIEYKLFLNGRRQCDSGLMYALGTSGRQAYVYSVYASDIVGLCVPFSSTALYLRVSGFCDCKSSKSSEKV
jgi:hypothetical protein